MCLPLFLYESGSCQVWYIDMCTQNLVQSGTFLAVWTGLCREDLGWFLIVSESMYVSVIEMKFYKLFETSFNFLGGGHWEDWVILICSCFQFASGVSQARSLTQIRLWLSWCKRAAVFQTATICILQMWQGSEISLLIQKEAVGIVKVLRGISF